MELLGAFLSEQTIERIGWVLVHFLWQGTAAAALMWCVLKGLSRASSHLRYIVACAGLAVMVAAPVTTFILLVPATPDEEVQVTYQQPIENSMPPAAAPEKTIVIVPAETVDLPAPSLWKRSIEWLESSLPYCVMGWFVGVAVLSVWYLGGWCQLQKLRRIGTKAIPEGVEANILLLWQRLGIRRAVQVFESALVQVPTVIGWLKPVILLPATALTGLDEIQLQAMLAHELAHIKRCDYLVNIAQTVVEILGFYHPAVWWASRQIRVEREHCCDDIAVGLVQNRKDYAGALFTMEAIRSKQHDLAVAANGGHLSNRISRLTGKPVKGYKSGWIPSVVILISLIILISSIFTFNSLSAQEGFAVTGTVTDAATGEPIAGAQVYDDGYNNSQFKTTTDENGSFSLNTFDEEHFISANVDGYEKQTNLLKTWPFSNNKNFNFKLIKKSEGKEWRELILPDIDGSESPAILTLDTHKLIAIQDDDDQAAHERWIRSMLQSPDISYLLYEYAQNKANLIMAKGVRFFGIDAGETIQQDPIVHVVSETLPDTFTMTAPDGQVYEFTVLQTDSTQCQLRYRLYTGRREDKHPARVVSIPQWPRIPLDTGGFSGYGSFSIQPMTERTTTSFSGPWEEVQSSDGKIVVPEGYALRLNIFSGNNTDLASLDAFSPDDIQVLALPLSNQIDSRAAPHIARLTGLQALFLGGSAIRDEDINHLTGLKELKMLSVQDCPLTDDAVEYLAKIKSLKQLILWGTAITEKGYDSLKNQLPQCNIQWEEELVKEQSSLRPDVEREVGIESSVSSLPASEEQADWVIRHVKRWFITVIADQQGQLSYNDQPVTFNQLETMLKADRTPPKNTVLEVGYTERAYQQLPTRDVVELTTLDSTFRQAKELVDEMGFESLSFIGPDHPDDRRGPISFRYEDRVNFSLDRDIKIDLSDGWELLDLDWIRFEQQGPNVTARIQMAVHTYPKTKWEIALKLFDKNGKFIESVFKYYENSGVVIGLPNVSREELVCEFDSLDVEKVGQFEIEVRKYADHASLRPRGGIQPVAVGVSQTVDPALERILLAQREILQEALEQVELQYEYGQIGPDAVAQAKIKLLEVESQLANTPQKRIELLQETVDFLKRQEQVIQQQLEFGVSTQSALNEAKLKRLEAEKALLEVAGTLDSETRIKRENVQSMQNQSFLSSKIDFSSLTADTTLDEAIELMRDSGPGMPLIIVLWSDLSENTFIEKDTPIGVDGLGVMKLETGLRAILRSMSSGGFSQVGFIVEDNVITIGTVDSLSSLFRTQDPAGLGATVKKLLMTNIDFSPLTSGTTFDEAVNFMRKNSSESLSIIVLWTDLSENAFIEKDTPIGVNGLGVMPLQTGLQAILRSMSTGGFSQVGFIVEDDLITIGTTESLSVTSEGLISGGMGGMMTGGGGMMGGGMGGMMAGGGGMMGGGMGGMMAGGGGTMGGGMDSMMAGGGGMMGGGMGGMMPGGAKSMGGMMGGSSIDDAVENTGEASAQVLVTGYIVEVPSEWPQLQELGRKEDSGVRMLTSDQLDAFIETVDQSSAAVLLSRPAILTNDNQDAEIHIGGADNEGYIKLNVTPHVAPDDETIRMEVEFEVSKIVDEARSTMSMASMVTLQPDHAVVLSGNADGDTKTMLLLLKTEITEPDPFTNESQPGTPPVMMGGYARSDEAAFEESGGMMMRIYDVSDLLNPPVNIQPGDNILQLLNEQMLELKQTIIQSVTQSSWRENGGKGMINIMTGDRGMITGGKLVIFQTPQVHEEIEAYLNRQRYELSKQIAIETRIMIVTDTFLEDIGLDEFLPESYETSGGMGEIVVGPANSAEILAVLEYIPLDERELPPLEDPKHTFQTLDDLKAEFLIRASQAHSNVKTLTAPKAMVLNGEAALMQIHSQLTYIDIDDEQKFLQKGITLDILPTMQDDDNEVLLKGYIQLNDVLEDRPVEHDGKTYTIPTVQVVNIPIHAVVQDEETLLIGGPELTVTKESVTNPGMGKIPILGRYLSNRSIVTDKQRLLVLIKPTIMIQEEAPEDAIGVLAPRPNGGGMMGGMGVGGGMMMGGYGAAAAGDMESVEER